MNKKLIWGIVIVVVVVSLGVSYVVKVNSQLYVKPVEKRTDSTPVKTDNSPAASPTPVVAELTETAATINWKMYDNQKYSYSLKYPTDVQITKIDITSGGEGAYSFTISENKKVIVAASSLKPNCSLRADGSDPDTVKINGIEFQARNISKELSTGTDGYYGVGTEYCLIKSGVSYRIVPQVRYKAGTPMPNLYEDVRLKDIVASFKFTN